MLHPLSQPADHIKRSFASREEWEEELARRKAARAAPSDEGTVVRSGVTAGRRPGNDAPLGRRTLRAPEALGTGVGDDGVDEDESDAERMLRISRERSFAAEIEGHHAAAAKLVQGVTPLDMAAWPAAPTYIPGGIVQNVTLDDALDETKYAWADVVRWRAHVAALEKLRGALRCAHCYGVAPKPPQSAMARCGRCHTARYCSAACQRTDWKVRHRNSCRAVE
ncbi:hypothetical protein M885DRAFT_538493 [Pelagophyceae sp. CCMP2097]|nr:hypothetical protein M885DRAFT_538493 [Pelagophyceae sp. CCMP2097]